MNWYSIYKQSMPHVTVRCPWPSCNAKDIFDPRIEFDFIFDQERRQTAQCAVCMKRFVVSYQIDSPQTFAEKYPGVGYQITDPRIFHLLRTVRLNDKSYDLVKNKMGIEDAYPMAPADDIDEELTEEGRNRVPIQ